MRAKETTSQHIRLQPFGKICLGRCSTKNLFATRERRRVTRNRAGRNFEYWLRERCRRGDHAVGNETAFWS
jgi:hypothetical protein